MSTGQNSLWQLAGAGGEVPLDMLLRELLPLIEHLIPIAERLLAASEIRLAGLPGSSCSRGGCKEPCGRLEVYLDGSYRCKVPGETTIGMGFCDSTGQQDGPEHIDDRGPLNADSVSAVPSDLYMTNENGQRRIVTAEEAEEIRQQWSGHFLLDLPRQNLLIRTGKAVKGVKLGSRDLHWGVEKVLIVGMSQPGVGFGYAKFSKVRPGGSGIGDVTALTRYVYEARRAIGDTGQRSRYIHKTRVEPSESPTRWGYVFDDRYRYLVIAKYSPTNYGPGTKSGERSRVDQERGQ